MILRQEFCMRYKLLSLVRNEAAATSIEYVLLASILAVGILASLPTLKTAILNKFTGITGNVTSGS